MQTTPNQILADLTAVTNDLRQKYGPTPCGILCQPSAFRHLKELSIDKPPPNMPFSGLGLAIHEVSKLPDPIRVYFDREHMLRDLKVYCDEN